ncbi:MAG: carboxypeptidase regulatory-like domain-containing protein [Candidatus Coatesbacteria bacterium]|nr:MAG: carboxypeptidase regulatory-like domain-containing protein [Candidatus Coatesbacteria bacterium]
MKKLMIITLALAAVSCRSDLFFGQVEGVAATVLAPNGRTPAYRAHVVIADLKPGGYYGETHTSAAGAFSFPTLPDGQYRLTATSPNALFSTEFHAEVLDGHSPGEVEVALQPARAEAVVNVGGRYDDMGELCTDLGYRYRTTSVAALAGTEDPLAGAKLVFINSGVEVSEAQNDVVVARLQSFVAGGGRLVVSDRAWPYVRAAWPGKIAWSAQPEIGNGAQEVEAPFVDTDLRKCVTVPTWRLRFELGGWAVPNGTTGTVLVEGAVETAAGRRAAAPLLVGFAAGAGYVAYSSFDWQTQYEHGRLAVRVFNYLLANK